MNGISADVALMLLVGKTAASDDELEKNLNTSTTFARKKRVKEKSSLRD
jgi:hypothetical protein